ncbi:MAG: hypothetical protein Q4C63_08060 [Eubacteriales bacterium]|nr:hypothetical protein [Eubacteriales bacterium]
MIELFDKEMQMPERKSSKGNQLKWERENIWYKADYTGYEGLSEYIVSKLLKLSNIPEEMFTEYETEQILYKKQLYLGCSSRNFLKDGWKLLTLERLFFQQCGESLYQSIFHIQGIKERAKFLVEQTESMTGLTHFGEYLWMLLTVDALFLNEDRHTHNIAILQEPSGVFHYSPIFDNGASLLSDTTMDYPLGEDNIYDLIDTVTSKTLCEDFREQLEAVEDLYGQKLIFSYDNRVLNELLKLEKYYPQEEKKRVITILLEQKRKYSYLFS